MASRYPGPTPTPSARPWERYGSPQPAPAQAPPEQGAGVRVRPPTPAPTPSVPSGYQPSGGGLTYTPGGPNDPVVIKREADARRGPEAGGQTPLDPEASRAAARREALEKIALGRRLLRRSRDDSFTGGWWQAFEGIPGTTPKDFAADTATMSNAGGLQKVLEMAAANGGKNPLAPLSEGDFKAISSSLSNLDPGQSDEQYQRNLNVPLRLYQQMYEQAGGADLERDLAALDGSSAPAMGAQASGDGASGPSRAGAMNEELVNTAQAPARVTRLSNEQGSQVLQAAQAGDVGQTMALLEQFTGRPADRAAITRAVSDYQKHPEAGIKLSYDDAGLEEFRRHGNHGQEQIEARRSGKIGPAASFGRQAANGVSLGLADPVAATMDTVFGGGKGDNFGERWQDNMQLQRAATDADYQENPYSSWGGTVAGSLLLPTRAPQAAATERAATLAGGGSLREAANAGRAASAARFGREGVVYGGVQGAANNIENPVDAVKHGAIGALGGGTMGYGMGRSMGAAVRPEARALMDEGIRPTTGQMVGGLFHQLEDKVAGAPIVGGTTARAQRRAVEDLNRAQINRALRPIGETLPRNVEVGTAAIDHATQRIGAVYERELPNISGQVPGFFVRRLAAVQRHSRIPPGTDGERNVKAAIVEALRPFNRGGSFTGRSWKAADESLGGLATQWAKSDDPYVRLSGAAAKRIREQLRRVVYSQNPQAATKLRAADKGFASLVRAQEAGVAARDTDGVFNARQLNQAVKQTDQSARRNATSRGRALDQDLSSPASLVLGKASAQSGARDANALIAAAALAAHSVTGNPMALGTGGLFAANKLMYSRPGQAAARLLLAGSGAQRAGRAAYQAPGAIESDIEDYLNPNGTTVIQIGGPR